MNESQNIFEVFGDFNLCFQDCFSHLLRAKEYSTLTLMPIPTILNEQRILNIMDLALEEHFLQGLIEEIDNKICTAIGLL